MIDIKILQRLGRATDKTKYGREALQHVHIKGKIAEVTDRKVLIQETLNEEAEKEELLHPKTGLQPKMDLHMFPNTEEVLKKAKEKPTQHTIFIARDVLKKFLDAIPNGAILKYEFKGETEAIVITTEDKKIEGLVLPINRKGR